MTPQELHTLMQQFEGTALTRLEYEEHGTRVVLQKGEATTGTAAPAAPASVPAAAVPPTPPPQAQTAAAGSLITAPLVGTFYAAPAPGAAPFAAPGTAVKKGDTVCVLEAMKMMNDVPAPFDCVIEEVLLSDGALAGFGDGLFRVREQ
jgi:acetyl-CoA carboxylase biotin carboxyl carrier protein